MSHGEYIHYGATSFDLAKFQPVKNHEWGAVKPIGGFWASPVNAELGWRQWCEDEQFCIDKLQESFEFDLAEDAWVFHVRSSTDLKKLPKWKGLFQSIWYCIDFEKAAETWDAIELHLSDEVKDDYLDSLYFRLYGWDCDSILIMNKDIIVA